MTKRVNSKNTKAEILEAFTELKKEKAALESQLKQVDGDKPSRVVPENGSGNSKAEVNENFAKEEFKQMNSYESGKPKLQNTIESLMILQAGFGGAASELSEKLTSKTMQLQELRLSVEEELQQLQDLHDFQEVDDETLDNLIEQYEQSAKTFGEEFDLRQETLQQEIQEGTKGWEKEQQEHQRAVKERNEERNKVRDRDEESYEYDLQLQRDIDIEEYEENKKRLYRELDEMQELEEKQWTERQKAIADREKQYAEVKEQVETFEKKLEDNIKSGKENGRNIGFYQAKIKSDLLAKEVEGNKQVYQLRIQSLNQTIQNQEARIQTLSQQLDSALKQVQDLAVKAIEGSSNVNSFQAVKEIAIEQAKNQQKNK